MTDIIDIPIIQLVIAYVFVLILLLIVRYRKMGHTSEILIASLRMTIQLILVGYVLTYIFANPSIPVVLMVLVLMEGFAIQNIYSRISSPISLSLKMIIGGAMVIGTGISIFTFLLVVVRLDPWYLPQYFIPISGMLIGNSMTGISLGIEGLINGIQDNKAQIENALMLGATPEMTTVNITNRAFYNAILPTLNSMIGMGIIFLPGMMTGQMLAGAPPLTAIKYQIAIMMGIMGSVTLTVYIMIHWGERTFFNDRKQLDLFNQD
ncbi:MAG: ABC transporter permease [bacterium]